MKNLVLVVTLSFLGTSIMAHASTLQSGLYVWQSGPECQNHLTTYVEASPDQVYFDLQKDAQDDGSYSYWIGLSQINQGPIEVLNADPYIYPVITSTEADGVYTSMQKICADRGGCSSDQIDTQFTAKSGQIIINVLDGKKVNCVYKFE